HQLIDGVPAFEASLDFQSRSVRIRPDEDVGGAGVKQFPVLTAVCIIPAISNCNDALATASACNLEQASHFWRNRAEKANARPVLRFGFQNVGFDSVPGQGVFQELLCLI